MKPTPPPVATVTKGPGLPAQLRLDVVRFLRWWQDSPGDRQARQTQAYSLYELKGHTGIPLLRLPEVLRHCGTKWVRMWDSDAKVHLWTCNLVHPLLLAQRGGDEEFDY